MSDARMEPKTFEMWGIAAHARVDEEGQIRLAGPRDTERWEMLDFWVGASDTTDRLIEMLTAAQEYKASQELSWRWLSQ